MGFSRQEYWSGLTCPSAGHLPTQGSNPGLPHCRQIVTPNPYFTKNVVSMIYMPATSKFISPKHTSLSSRLVHNYLLHTSMWTSQRDFKCKTNMTFSPSLIIFHWSLLQWQGPLSDNYNKPGSCCKTPSTSFTFYFQSVVKYYQLITK